MAEEEYLSSPHPLADFMASNIMNKMRQRVSTPEGQSYTLNYAVYDALDHAVWATDSKRFAGDLIEELKLTPDQITQGGLTLRLEDFKSWKDYYREMSFIILSHHIITNANPADKALIEERFKKEWEIMRGNFPLDPRRTSK